MPDAMIPLSMIPAVASGLATMAEAMPGGFATFATGIPASMTVGLLSGGHAVIAPVLQDCWFRAFAVGVGLAAARRFSADDGGRSAGITALVAGLAAAAYLAWSAPPDPVWQAGSLVVFLYARLLGGLFFGYLSRLCIPAWLVLGAVAFGLAPWSLQAMEIFGGGESWDERAAAFLLGPLMIHLTITLFGLVAAVLVNLAIVGHATNDLFPGDPNRRRTH